VDQLVLSFNDIPLLLVIFQSLLFSILLLFANIGNRRANLFLAGFVLALGLDAFDTLIYWSPSIKQVYLLGQVHIFYWLKFSVYLAAPLLYLYVKAVIHADYNFHRYDLKHFIPLALFPFFIMALYASLSPEERVLGITQYKTSAFQFHLWTRHLLYIGYGFASLRLLHQYQEELKQRFSNIDKIDVFWLKLLIGGFLTIWGWVFASYLLTFFNYSAWLGNLIGIAGNIFSFVFINTLVLYSIAKANRGQREIVSEPVVEPPDTKTSDDQDVGVVAQVTQLMEQERLYLDPELTLEQLAEAVKLSPRKISGAINRHCEQNFFDYINGFRVKAAVRILEQKGMEANMLDVIADSGFNSKSTFYRAFKRVMAMSPSEFCDQLSKPQQPPSVS
jgi:AraC-like DNA-binding protein